MADNDEAYDPGKTLQSSSEHRELGLMSPNARRKELARIIRELRFSEDAGREPTREEVDAAQDLCWRLFSHEVASQIAGELGASRDDVRRAIDRALQWVPTSE